MRHGHDTRDIVLLETMFLLAEVAHQMAAFTVILGENIEQEWLNIIIQGLVIKEELHQQTQILTVDLVCVSINLKD